MVDGPDPTDPTQANPPAPAASNQPESSPDLTTASQSIAASLRQTKERPAAKRGAQLIEHHLVILTGMSGAGKQSALRAFEDQGFYAVDNPPLELIPQFAELVRDSTELARAVLGVDVRESLIEEFPRILQEVRKLLPVTVVFLDATDEVLVRRFSETRRPHPLGRDEGVLTQIRLERQRLETIRNVADTLIDTSRFNVHELRAHINAQFGPKPGEGSREQSLLLSVMSFGFKNGVPPEADLLLDVRFLPNPHFVPEFRHKTGQDAKVAEFVMSFPQTGEFLDRTTDMLLFLLPHYIHEGKSYLTVALGCTGGQHRSVALTEELSRRLTDAGYRVKSSHRDMPR